jgi:2,3-dihydroxybenzoate decarboxylase
MKKIALEEHFLAPGFEEYWQPTMTDVAAPVRDSIHVRLTDFGDLRLDTMDRAGIDRSILSLAGPGVQAERDMATATRRAHAANDFLANVVLKAPHRYSGFAHLAIQDPLSAADELERCVRDLGFCGAMINGHTNGKYLDDRAFAPLWERVETLQTVIYLHPADPVAAFPVLAGHQGLRRATWEWTMETASHALRLIFGGVFDRYPRAQLALGHLGETLPYLMSRFDSRAKLYGVAFARKPSDYIRDNVIVTTSGLFASEPLDCAIKALGAERVMFSSDYPFESSEEASAFIEGAAIDALTREMVCFRNAADLFRLDHATSSV